jgi:uncharacterized membrane protein YfcA
LSPLIYLLVIFITSIGAGTAGAILGLGGGMLLVPILTMFFGVDLRYAMGAGIISVIATSSGAAAAYLKTRLSNIRVGLFLGTATTFGAVIGAHLTTILPVHVIEFVLALALGYSALVTLQQFNVELPGEVPDNGWSKRFSLEGEYFDIPLGRNVSYCATHVGRGFGAMFGAGVLSGLLGIGSGAFKVLAMDYFMRLPMKVSTATSNFMVGLTAAASAGVYLTAGKIHPVLSVPVAAGVLTGAAIGTRIMSKLRNVTVRKAFLPILIYLAASMFLRSLGIKLL